MDLAVPLGGCRQGAVVGGCLGATSMNIEDTLNIEDRIYTQDSFGGTRSVIAVPFDLGKLWDFIWVNDICCVVLLKRKGLPV